jgi:hypothetical protein
LKDHHAITGAAYNLSQDGIVKAPYKHPGNRQVMPVTISRVTLKEFYVEAQLRDRTGGGEHFRLNDGCAARLKDDSISPPIPKPEHLLLRL